MNDPRRVTLIVAIVLALGTGLLTLRYLSSLQAQSAPPPAATREILISTRDIPAREKLTLDMVTKITRPANEVDPDAISDPKEIAGTRALITIPQGSTITSSKVGHSEDMAMPVRLKPGMRALTLSGDRVRAVSGFVQPGDRVDIIAIPPARDGIPHGVTILRAILVLAVNSTMEEAANGGTSPPNTGDPNTITVAVTPNEADLLAAVDQSIPLRLALRPPQESVRSLPNETLVLPTDPPRYVPPPPPAQTEYHPAAQAPVSRPAPQQPNITVIDGDKVVTGH